MNEEQPPDVLSDEAFEDECAMRAMHAQLSRSIVSADVTVWEVVRWSSEVAAAMRSERHQRRHRHTAKDAEVRP